MLPRLEVVRRLRPVDLVAPGSVLVEQDTGGVVALPAAAPYVAATTDAGDRASLALHLADHRVGATMTDGSVSLTLDRAGTTRELRSRRFHRSVDATALGLSLTGTHVTAWSRRPGAGWPAPGTTTNSKSLLALINAFTTCIVLAGSTLRSISPTINSSLPCRFFAIVTFDCSS